MQDIDNVYDYFYIEIIEDNVKKLDFDVEFDYEKLENINYMNEMFF